MKTFVQEFDQEFGLRTRWYILRCLAGEVFEWVWRDVLVVKYLFRREYFSPEYPQKWTKKNLFVVTAKL